jgi:hypothetical protein
MGELVVSESTKSRGVNEISDKLVEVETLYVLASKPVALQDLVSRLRTIFAFESNIDGVNEVLEQLQSRKMVRRFSYYPTTAIGSGQESFSITPLGLSKLGEWLESLSEITLTMQLGLDQRIMVAED